MRAALLCLVASPWGAAEEAADKVDAGRLAAHVVTLQEDGTRFSGTVGAASARAYVWRQIEALGLEPSVVEHLVDDPLHGERRVLAKNVVVTVGRGEPSLFVIAHLDTKASNDESWRFDRDPAPGADDNASGSAALIEALRVVKPKGRVVFVWTDAEELARIDDDGFMSNIGAEAIADGTPRGSAIAVDMFLRPRPWGSSLRVYDDGRLASATLTEVLVHAAWIVAPTLEITRFTDPSFTYSDHGSFWSRGMGGVLLIEDDFHHARYHRQTDRWDAADSFYSLEQLEQATRILAAAITVLSSA